jgi:regulator of protease activity HflC (stomatin/prohibitin superfamily)
MQITYLSVFFLALLCVVQSFFTRVPEGHVAVYSVMGQIQDETIKQSAFYFPLYSSIQLVEYRQDRDYVRGTTCVSSEGVPATVSSIEIANEINPRDVVSTVRRYGFEYDKVLVVNPLDQFMREICANLTIDEIEITRFHEHDDRLKREIQHQNDELKTGITINYVRVSGIIIPEEIKAKRLELAKEKANKILAEEKMKRTEIEKASEVLIAKRDNDIKAENSKRENERFIQSAQAEREKKQIENAILLEATQTNVKRIKLEAIANAEKMELEARALRELYSIEGYADVQKVQAISDRTSMIYYGEKIPAYMPYGTAVPNAAPAA